MSSIDDIFNLSREKLVLDKESFDYLGLLYVDKTEYSSLPADVREHFVGLVTVGSDVLDNVFSRGSKYYLTGTLDDFFDVDDQIAEAYRKLSEVSGSISNETNTKLTFSLLENRINLGLKIYYSIFAKALRQGILDTESFDVVRNRLRKDYSNILKTMFGMPLSDDLQETFRGRVDDGFTIPGRLIEMDHKYLLFSRMVDLYLSDNKFDTACAPMLGGIELPFMLEATYDLMNELTGLNVPVPKTFHMIYGEHDNKEYGDIVKSDVLTFNEKLEGIIPVELHDEIQGENLLIMDDNTGTGETLRNLSTFFSNKYKSVEFAFVEISWKYLNDITTGKRQGLCFDVNEIAYPTFRNYRHHRDANALVQSIMFDDPEEYFMQLKKMGFQNGYIADSDCLFNQGINYARKNGISFTDKNIQRAAEKAYELETADQNFILSLDIMDHKIRYLEQYDPFEIADLVMNFKTVNVIDIDRHKGLDYNEELIRLICSMKDCRVGGGIRSEEDVRKLLGLGADKVIITTYATKELLQNFSPEQILLGIDSIDRRTGEPNDVLGRMREMSPNFSAVNYICVETDGKMMGGDLERGIGYAKFCDKPYAIVGGITYKWEVDALKKHGIGATVGRAIFENMFGDKL